MANKYSMWLKQTKKTSQNYQREIKSGADPANRKGLMSRRGREQPKRTTRDFFETRSDT